VFGNNIELAKKNKHTRPHFHSGLIGIHGIVILL